MPSSKEAKSITEDKMSEVLTEMKVALSQGMEYIKELSDQLPGTVTQQALILGMTVGVATYLLLKKHYHLPPGPFKLPLVGNLLSVIYSKEPFYKTLLRWSREKYGPVITVYIGPLRCVTLNRIDVVMEALVKKKSDFAGRPYLYSVHSFTNGGKDIAFTTYSPTWKLHKTIASQAVRHFMTGHHFEQTVQDVVTKMMNKMSEEKDPFDPSGYLTSLMFTILDIFCFGVSKELDDPQLKRISFLFDEFGKIVGNGFWEDLIPPLRIFPTRKFKLCSDSFLEIRNYLRQEMKRHKDTFSAENIRDMADSILLAQQEIEREQNPDNMAMITEDHVVMTVGNLFTAGSDTTRATLLWVFYYLAGHPEVQSKVQAEIDAATEDQLPSLSMRCKLSYTEAMLYEVMRIATVAPIGVAHTTMCDTTVGGYEIPKGTMVIINHWALHNDPDKWDQPHLFHPERFLDSDGKLAPKPESWLPFSAGHRVCLGETVVKPELVLLLTFILKRLTISLPPGAKFDPQPIDSFLAGPPKPFKIVVTERTIT